MRKKKEKKDISEIKKDYMYKIGIFLFFIGLLIMMFAMYLSFRDNKNLKSNIIKEVGYNYE